MKTPLSRFAPIGLYLSLAGAIAAVGIYIVMQEFNLPLQIALGVVVLGLALFALLDPQRVRQIMVGRQMRHGSNAFVLTVAFIGILIVVNILVNSNSRRWDLTEDKEHTLAEETIAILEELPAPVTAVAFFQESAPIEETQNLLEDFKYYSDGKFDYQFIDPDADPVAAENAKITRYSTIVLKMQDRQEPAKYNTEADLASAMVRLLNPGERTVYFLGGHGEYDPESTEERSYSVAKRTLESKNYTVQTINLLTTPAIPEDAMTIVIPGPRSPLDESEINRLREYMANGGSLIVMVEPEVFMDLGNSPDRLADYLAADWGVSLDDNLVMDMAINPPTVAIGNPRDYGTHAITDDLRTRNIVTLFPTARSLQGGANTALSSIPLVKTSDQTWGETDMVALQNSQTSADPEQDLLGPLTIAYAIENSQAGSRIVVIGDSDFAANGNFEAYANGSLFTNAVDWAASQEGLINLTPKEQTQRFLVLPQRYAMNIILLGSVFVFPAAILVSGIIVWLQRRRRG
jgi:ABC-type uncharacterized transport system involved in gliding motility auxiliary subunit